MTAAVLTDTLVLGALTGMRSMSGPAILAAGRGGVLPRLALTLAAGEMVADKTEAIGDRIDPLPLGGRAAMGALVGGIIAHDRRGNRLLGAALGAAAAVVMAHAACYLRKRAPGANLLGGLTEDAIVTGIGAIYAGRLRR
jgi:uncharacterized membrane protein